MTTTSESPEFDDDGFPDDWDEETKANEREWQRRGERNARLEEMRKEAETARRARMTPEQRAAEDARFADDDWIEDEDPEAAAREAALIAALKDEEVFVQDLSRRGLDKMPNAIRKLYRQNPNNPKIRELYDSLVQELYDRTDDALRTALPSAVDRMVDLIDCEDEKVALRAATYVFERLRGKTPEVHEHRQPEPFQLVLTRLATGPRPGAHVACADRTALPAAESPLDAEIVLESDTEPVSIEADPYQEERALAAEWARRPRSGG